MLSALNTRNFCLILCCDDVRPTVVTNIGDYIKVGILQKGTYTLVLSTYFWDRGQETKAIGYELEVHGVLATMGNKVVTFFFYLKVNRFECFHLISKHFHRDIEI